jgi:hypothetical protein
VSEEDAMGRDSKVGMIAEEVVEFGADTIEQVMRERVRATMEAIVEEELEAALGARRSAIGRLPRLSYRRPFATRDSRRKLLLIGVAATRQQSRATIGLTRQLLSFGSRSISIICSNRIIGR